MDGIGRGRAVGRRAQGPHLRNAGAARAPAAAGRAPLSYGRRVPRGSGGGGGARRGPVRLRRADPQRPEGPAEPARRPANHRHRGPPRRAAPAQPAVRRRAVHHVLAGLPATPVRGGGAARAPAPLAPQCALPDPADRGDARGDPGGGLRAVGRRLAAPLHSRGNAVIVQGLFALLLAPSGNAGPGMGLLLLQLGLIFGLLYFLILRPQRRQQEQHKKLLETLQRGDQIVTSGGIVGEGVHLKDSEVTIRSGEAELVVLRGNIASIVKRAVEAKAS